MTVMRRLERSLTKPIVVEIAMMEAELTCILAGNFTHKHRRFSYCYSTHFVMEEFYEQRRTGFKYPGHNIHSFGIPDSVVFTALVFLTERCIQ